MRHFKSSRVVSNFWSVVALVAVSLPALASTDLVVPPGRSTNPSSIAVGPDNNLWFTELGGGKIGRLTTAGVMTEFPIANAQALFGIASGPDGNIWFTDQLAGKVGHINTSGTGIVQYSLPAGTFPEGITSGPDGNLWFLEQVQSGNYKIAKITTAGKITSYSTKVNAGTLQVYSAAGYAYGFIAAGPDGNLWFVNPQNGAHSEVGKITTKGVVTFYPTADLPLGIAPGPDGNLWVTELSHVAKITTAGVETEYAITNGGTQGIVSGPDGNLWFGEANYSFGKITPAGAVTEYATVYPEFWIVSSIVSGPNGALWFTGEFTDNIGELSTSAAVTGNFALSTGAATGFDALGPDGNIWFSESFPNNSVGKMTPEGVVTTYPLPTAHADPVSIITGPDGNLWVVEGNAEQIAKVTTSGTITEYPVKGYVPFGITAGPDGNLWFPYDYAKSCACSAIGRITPDGTISVFPTTTALSAPLFITTGPDGNLWFTELAANQIGKMSSEGVPLAEYPVKTKNANLSSITSGPDGNLWFLENTPYGAVGKITTSGVVTEYKAQMQNYQNGIVSAGDGALWFAQAYPNSVARITTKGVVSEVPLSSVNAVGNSLTVGPDGRLWVAEGMAGSLGRLSAIGGSGTSFSATHGVAFSGELASFVDGTPAATASNFTATITWGDGSTSAGTVTGSTGGPFQVKGTHTYSAAGTFHTSVSLSDTVDNSTYVSTKGKATVN